MDAGEKDYSEIKLYRLIALLNMIETVFESTLASNISYLVQPYCFPLKNLAFLIRYWVKNAYSTLNKSNMGSKLFINVTKVFNNALYLIKNPDKIITYVI